MANANKRRQRELEWKRAKARREGDPKGNPDSLSPELERRALRLVHYEITFEPLLDKVEPGKSITKCLGEEEREELFLQVRSDPAAAEVRLRSLISAHPDCPVLTNWLCTALEHQGRRDEVLPIVEESYRKYPTYLFGLINYASMLLASGNVAACTELLDKRFDLSLLCPGRTKFHIMEFRAFVQLMVSYFIQLKQIPIAKRYVSMLEKVDPDDEETHELQRRVEMAGLLDQMKAAIGRGFFRRRAR